MTAEQRSRVLVTGGSGFIGRRLVRALLESGAEVTVADLLEPTEPGVHAVVGDLRDESVAARAVSPGTDTIFHLAAVTSVLRSLEDPAGTYQTNVQATATLLELARTRGVGSFILASTNAVVGDVGRNVITEQAALRPLTPYGATKAAGEMLVSCYTAAYGIAGCALRFSNVYGPGMQHKDSFVPRLMRAARDGHGVQVYGDGTQIRDLIHVDDIVSALLLAWRSRAHRLDHHRGRRVRHRERHHRGRAERHRVRPFRSRTSLPSPARCQRSSSTSPPPVPWATGPRTT